MYPALELLDVEKMFSGRRVLDRLSLAVAGGEYMTVLGASGSGKSTLLRIITGFEPPDAGDVQIGGVSVQGQSPHQRGVGFVFQSFALFPHLSVADNVGFGLHHRQNGAVTDATDRLRRVADALELVGLQGLGDRLPAQISGGQKQRVAFARTLIAEPRVVLLDEPLGALDARLRERMMAELRRIHSHLGATFLHVTGNEQEALAMGMRVAVLADGRISQVAAPDALMEVPATHEVAKLLNCYNLLPGRVEGGVFTLRDLRLPLARSAADGPAAYGIRYDRVTVAAPDMTADSGQVRMPGRFLASEYSGPRTTSLFDVGGASPFEVEYYLGHRQPPAFERGRDYALQWAADAALIFPAP